MFSDVPPRQGGSLADAAFCARTRTRACAMRCTTTTACCLFHSTSAIAYNYLQEPQKITPCDAFCRFVPSASAVAGSCRGPQQVGGLRSSEMEPPPQQPGRASKRGPPACLMISSQAPGSLSGPSALPARGAFLAKAEACFAAAAKRQGAIHSPDRSHRTLAAESNPRARLHKATRDKPLCTSGSHGGRCHR